MASQDHSYRARLLDLVRRGVEEGTYFATLHFYQELKADRFTLVELEAAIMESFLLRDDGVDCPTGRGRMSGKGFACHLCGGAMRQRSIEQDLRVGGALIVIRNLPAWVCERCGEKVLGADVLRQVERLTVPGEESFPAAVESLSVPIFDFESLGIGS